ncbi:MAG: hypothetical protein ABSD10_00590 [Candidatus Saccharimonadales bacterium]|jgi:hypothetical protein
MSQTTKIVRTLPWGEEIYLEIPLHKKSANKFYARHGKTSEGREYIEFSKFGPKPNTEGESYMQKLRLYAPLQWAQIKHYVDGELANSIGWDLKTAQKEFEDSLLKEESKAKDREKVTA